MKKNERVKIMKIKVDEAKCIGCGTCVALCPKCFEIVGSVSRPKNTAGCFSADCDLREVAESCPVGAILVEEEEQEKAN